MLKGTTTTVDLSMLIFALCIIVEQLFLFSFSSFASPMLSYTLAIAPLPTINVFVQTAGKAGSDVGLQMRHSKPSRAYSV